MCIWTNEEEEKLKVILNDLHKVVNSLYEVSAQVDCPRIWAVFSDLDRIFEEMAVQVLIPAPCPGKGQGDDGGL